MIRKRNIYERRIASVRLLRAFFSWVLAVGCFALAPGSISDLQSVSATEPLSISSLASGSSANHTCALLNDATVRCWGYNSDGQLGLEDTASRGDDPNEMGFFLPPVDVGQGTVSKVVVNAANSCVLTTGGLIRCWGSNTFGQLGIGDTFNRGDNEGEMGEQLASIDLGTGRTAVDLALGAYHACAILDNNEVKCWGGNYNGSLGRGGAGHIGDQPNEMGDNLPAVDLGTAKEVRQLALGFRHSCVLFFDGTVKCWGDITHGQLGLEESQNHRGDEAGEMGANLPYVDFGTGLPAVQIVAGSEHTCIRSSEETLSRVKCWGQNRWGALGTGDTYSYGYWTNSMGGNLPTVGPATGMISAGRIQTCLLSGGALACKGGGWLSDGSPSYPNVYSETKSGSFRSVAQGYGHVCGLKTSGDLVCWGFNRFGELGIGNTTFVGENPYTIHLFDETPPTVLSGGGSGAFSINSYAGGDGRYVAGENIDVVVTFSEPVVITGTPILGVTVGSVIRSFSYFDQPSSTQIRFRYTVVAGDEDDDGIQIGANALTASGTNSIRDLAGNDADLSHFAQSISSNHKVDAVVASAVWSESPSHRNQQTVPFFIRFSEGLVGIDSSDFSTSGTARGCVVQVDFLDLMRRVTVTCASDGTVRVELRENAGGDNAGNLAPATNVLSEEVVIDTVVPVVSWKGAETPVASRTVELELQVSEEVLGLSIDDISNVGTARGCQFSMAGESFLWKVSVTCESDGTVIAQFAKDGVADLANNNAPVEQMRSNAIQIDTTPTPPRGDAGVSIDSGASFTRTQTVSLSIIWPKGATEMKISNDGGFAEARAIRKPVSSTTDWDLDTSISNLHTKIVYVRFIGDDIDRTKTYSDDIVYDPVAPKVSSSRLLVKGMKFQLEIDASDDVTGLSEVTMRYGDRELKRPHAPALEVESSELELPMGGAPVEVQLSDRAGNLTPWFTVQPVSSGQAVFSGSDSSAKSPYAGSISRRQETSSTKIARLASLKASRGSRIVLRVSRASRGVCAVRDGSLVAARIGTCAVSVTVISKSGKRTSRTVSLRVR